MQVTDQVMARHIQYLKTTQIWDSAIASLSLTLKPGVHKGMHMRTGLIAHKGTHPYSGKYSRPQL